MTAARAGPGSRASSRVVEVSVTVLASAAVAAALASGPGTTRTAGYLVLAAVAAALALAAPLQWLVPLCFLAFIVSDTTLLPNLESSVYFYARFAPLIIVAARYTAHVAAHPSERPLRSVLWRPFVLVFVFDVLSTAWAATRLDTFLRAISMGVVLVGLGEAVPYLIGDDGAESPLYRTVTYTVSFAVLGSFVLGPFSPEATLNREGVSRVLGAFDNANTLGLLAMLSFFLLLGLSPAVPRAQVRWNRVLMGVMLSFVVLAGSRASLLGLAAGAVTYVALTVGDVREKVAALAGGVLLVLALTHVGTFGGVLRTDNGERVQVWTNALRIGRHTLVQGVGFGSADSVLTRSPPFLSSHNEYIHIFVSTGLIGVALSVGALLWVLVRGVGQAVDDRRLGARFPIALVALVVAALVDAFFEDWIFGFGGGPSLPFWFAITLLQYYVIRRRSGGTAGFLTAGGPEPCAG